MLPQFSCVGADAAGSPVLFDSEMSDPEELPGSTVNPGWVDDAGPSDTPGEGAVVEDEEEDPAVPGWVGRVDPEPGAGALTTGAGVLTRWPGVSPFTVTGADSTGG